MKRYISASVSSFNDEPVKVRVTNAMTSRVKEVLEKCFNDENYYVREGLLCNPNTPDYMIDDLLEVPAYASDVAKRLDTRPDVLRRLAVEESGLRVLRLLSRNPNTPADALAKLWHRPELRSEVSANPGISDELLDMAINAKDLEARIGALLNPRISADVLVRFAGDEEPYVREAVAGNNRTPLEVLRKLSKDIDLGVRMSANYTLSNLGEA